MLYNKEREMKDHKLEQKIEALKSGDSSAFDYVYERTYKTAYFTILYIIKDKQHAEDILQETFVKAVSYLYQYSPGTNFIGWLCAIAKSLALNHLKKYKREIATDFDAEAYKYGSAETKVPYVFDLAAKILSEDEYKIVMLCQVAGYKRREVAAAMNMPIGTVTWKNNEALKKLKKALKEDEA